MQLAYTTPVTDDAGAETADRFEWQATMAAADGLSMYLDEIDEHGQLHPDHGCQIICEHHEDWIVVVDETLELVSAKHREPARGAYTTLTKLADDGGLRHLFTRWVALQEQPTCRLVTTGGLSPGDPQDFSQAAQTLNKARIKGEPAETDKIHDSVLATFGIALLRLPRDLPTDWQSLPLKAPPEAQMQQLRRFTSRLTIQHSEVHRSHVTYAAPAMYAEPVLLAIGITMVDPAAVWEAVLGLFRLRMRASGPTPTGALPSIQSLVVREHATLDQEAGRALARRIISLDDIDAAIRVAIESPGGYLPLGRIVRTSRVACKMAAGYCSDNSIERAEQLRLDYQGYWRDQTAGGTSTRSEQDRLRRTILGLVDSLTSEVRDETRPWGPRLWTGMQSKVKEIPPSQRPAGLDDDLILGGMCDLANRCKVWFTHRFDVDAAIKQARIRRGGT